MAVALGGSPVVAQQTQTAPGPTSAKTGTLTFTSRLELDTNPNLEVVSPGTQVTLDETLGFSLSAETRNQTISLSGSGSLSYSVGALGTSSSITEPTLQFGYLREAANSGLSIDYSYWDGEVVSSFDSDPTAAVNIVVDEGFLTRQSGQITLDLGRQAPFSTSLSVSQTVNDYSDTIDPGLFDETTTTYESISGLRFSGVTQGTLTLRYTDYDSDDATNTASQTTDLILDLSHELRRGLTIDASLGVQQQTLRMRGTPSDVNGTLASLGLNQQLPDGSIFGSIGYDGTGGTDRTSLTFGRSLDMPTGTLSGSITAANVDGSGVQIFGSAGYTRALPDGTLDLQLNQSLVKDQSNNDVLWTRLDVGYAKQINANSNLDVSLNFARNEDGGAGNVATQNRGTFVARVDRNLTPEWDMSYGYRFRFYDDQATSLRGSNSLFVSVSRNFQFNF